MDATPETAVPGTARTHIWGAEPPGIRGDRRPPTYLASRAGGVTSIGSITGVGQVRL